MAKIIDVSTNCADNAAALAAAGVQTVIRYYSRDTIRPAKRLTPGEARALCAAGLRIGVVHEGRYGDVPANFTHDCGFADGQYAQHYGLDTIGQPHGTTIWFGVDFDATAEQLTEAVLPYFQGIADGLKAAGGAVFDIGVYGSGRTCAAVLDARLASRAWLAQSTGWSQHAAFAQSGRATLIQGPQTKIAGTACDPDELGAGKSLGDFICPPAGSIAPQPDNAQPASLPSETELTRRYVIARSGLRVREGPGTDFAAKPQALPFGARVFALKRTGGWTLIDLQGDGKADGYVSSEFLDSTLPARPAAAMAMSGDAGHVAALIVQGSTADGLERARKTAAAAWHDYPHDGCAAHLSALLQQAGIGVPMTLGAGALARVLAQRGWARIARGNQIAGDVGVCYDLDPTPAGADHIYLVVQRIDSDQMLVADNQRQTDAPHIRFASGHGKTPTEYFLRAQ